MPEEARCLKRLDVVDCREEVKDTRSHDGVEPCYHQAAVFLTADDVAVLERMQIRTTRRQ